MTTLAQDVLLSLPPLESGAETTAILEAAQSLPGYSDSAKAAWEQHTASDSASSTTSSAATGPLADAIIMHLEKYANERYKNVTFRHLLLQENDSAANLLLYTYAELLEPHKSQSGYWATACEIHGKKLARGSIRVQAHYYEGTDQNIQFRASRQFTAQDTTTTTAAASADQDAQALIRHWISQVETLHDDLLQLADNECQTSLKRVRRILPITKTRMNWSDAAQEQVSLLNQSVTAGDDLKANIAKSKAMLGKK